MNKSLTSDKILITLPPPVRDENSGQSNKKTILGNHVQSEKSQKEPKFVPYEPYKGAVKPMVFDESTSRKYTKSPIDKNIVKSIANMCMKKNDQLFENKCKPLNELSNIATVMPRILSKLSVVTTAQQDCTCNHDDSSVLLMKEELENTRTENTNLREQLLQQIKINTELKKLLIASVGDDLESKLQFLTEDKVKLAHDVNHYVQRLFADHEELEKLSIQCDVWRSKFLASSLIVDELANWKAVLSHRYDESLDALHTLLDEHQKISDHLTASYRYLKDIESAYSPSSAHPKSLSTGTIIDLSEAVEKNSEKLHHHFVNSSNSSGINLPEKFTPTVGEQKAQQVLNGATLYNLPLECTKLIAGSGNLRSGIVHRFHPNTRYEHLTMNCCSHCRGDILLL